MVLLALLGSQGVGRVWGLCSGKRQEILRKGCNGNVPNGKDLGVSWWMAQLLRC